jgi:hypothetical protein
MKTGSEIDFGKQQARVVWISGELSASENQISPSKLPSRKWVSKAPQSSSMLDLSSQSEVCLAFFLCQEQGY